MQTLLRGDRINDSDLVMQVVTVVIIFKCHTKGVLRRIFGFKGDEVAGD
jgi:hypothetical protein